MSLRLLAIGLCLALALASCGDEDEPRGATATTSTVPAAGDRTLAKSVPPLAAAPNVTGGDAPIDAFTREYAAAATAYWADVFDANGLRYETPRVVVATGRARACAATRFDPAAEVYALCPQGSAAEVLFGAPALDRTRNSLGDGAVAFVTGYGVAIDALDQLEGRPLLKRRPVDEKFTHGAVCLTGTWVEHITKEDLLQAGDSQELLNTVERFVPGRTELDVSLGQDLLALGVSQGPGACLKEARG
jgi:predicted metalloprotease